MILTLMRDYASTDSTTLRLVMIQRSPHHDWFPIWRGPAWSAPADEATDALRCLYRCDRCGQMTKRHAGLRHWPRGGRKCGGRWIEQ